MLKSALFLLLFFPLVVYSQDIPPLERLVSLELTNKKLSDVLDEIEKQANVSFSYNSNLVEAEKLVSIRSRNRPVREVLKKLLGDGIELKSKKNYIILTRAPVEKKAVVSGYVQTPEGKPVEGATVYDNNTLASANTNRYGYYEMKIERNYSTQLKVSKRDYHDTLAPLTPHGGELRNIVIQSEKQDTTWRGRLGAWSDSTIVFFGKLGQELRIDSLFPEPDSLKRAQRDSIRDIRMQQFSDSTKARWSDFKQWLLADSIRMTNVDDTIYRRSQISFLPYIGTNRKMSGQCINDFSFNVLGGYSLGSRVMELGAFANIDRGNVSGIQMAGFTNVVGGNVSGLQMAGYFNLNKGNTAGAQFSGFSNINLGTTSGLQASGFSNVNLGKSDGIILAGFSNVCLQDANGLLMSGFANVVKGKTDGAQIAGFANFATGEVKGLQIAGFMNTAKSVKGSQIGFLNFADTLTGVPIGFLSFVKKGYCDLELSASDAFYANASLRTGVRKFYNILNVGIKPSTLDKPVWTYGYGLGTSPRLTDYLYLNIDLTANHVVSNVYRRDPIVQEITYKMNSYEVLNLDNQLYLGAEIRLHKKVGLTGGVLIHGWLTEKDYIYSSIRENNVNSYIENTNWGNVNMKMWWGWKVGVRLF